VFGFQIIRGLIYGFKVYILQGGRRVNQHVIEH